MPPRSLTDLIDPRDPAWPLVQQWIAAATNPVVALPVDRTRAEATLVALQVTTRSPMGALALECGGLLVDHGFLRVLGGGSGKMQGDLRRWNGHGEDAIFGLDGAMVVAHDAVGGLFAINGGVFEGEPGSVFYFSPDTLEWEDTELGYSDWLSWALTGDLEEYYANIRWPGWEAELAPLSPDQGISIAPPPAFAEGGSVAERSRKAVPIEQLVRLYLELSTQMQA